MNSLIIFCAKYLVFLVPLVIVVVWFDLAKQKRIKMLLTVAVAAVAAIVIARLSGKLYYDPRPFVSHNIKPLFEHGADNGFPSEHTTLASTLATIVYFYRRNLGYLAFGVSLVVGIARVMAHVHSPIDILGGLLIGIVAGWIGHKVVSRFLAKKESTD